MSFFQNFKAKKAAKKAKKLFESELAEYNSESELLSRALEIFSDAAKGEEPSDQGLVQKARRVSALDWICDLSRSRKDSI
jgi:hypothetical protein